MKNVKLLTIVATCLLMTSIFAVIPAFSVQPPLIPGTYYVGTIGQPKNLDPARAYDTASGEIIQNCLQTLIWYGNRNVISFSSGVGYNVSAYDLADLSVYKPVIATEVPTIANGRITYNGTDYFWVFTINSSATFPAWTAGNGTAMPAAPVTVDDVVYSFQRQMVYDSSAAPTWMWYQPAFNPAWYTWDDAFGYTSFANGTFSVPADEVTAANLIKAWVFPGPGIGNVTFEWHCPYAETAMYQIFSQTWGCIVQKAWVIDHGGWDGLFTPGWTNNYRQKPSNDYSELDVYKDPAIYGAAHGSHYLTGTHDVPNMLGTGPYKFTSWDKTTSIWEIDYNPSFWQGFATAGAGDGLNFIHTVIVSGIASWPTRKMLFLNGEVDAAVVPTSNMYDLLTDFSTPIAGINMAYNIPTLQTDEFFFTTNLTATSPYQSFAGYPSHTSGAAALFFADQNIRTAFAWAFNYTEYKSAVWFNQMIQHGSWWATGLTPVNANDTFLPLRNVDLTQMQYWLDKAALVDGHNVSTDGFDVTFLYNTGNAMRQIACQALADSWSTLNSKYHVSVIAVDWPTFLTLMVTKGMAGYCLGWLADFADAVDFAGVYMATGGSFSAFQGPPYPADQATIDLEIIQASTAAEPQRVILYHDLESRYWNNCLSIALDQPVGRAWARDWVQGRSVNQLWPGLVAYFLYKAIIGVVQSIDLNIQSSLNPIVNYTTIYIYQNQMRVGGGLGSGIDPITPMKYFLDVHRTEANGGAIYATIGLKRTPGEFPDASEFANGTYVLVTPGGSANKTLTWYENGASQKITGASWKVGGKVYTVGASSYPLTSLANDTSLSNNEVTNGTFHATTLPGDIDGNGIVDIYDALKLSAAFGANAGQKKYNALADLNSDATIDIYDAIILASNFNKAVLTA
ncbi:MAG: ABC transporter substrate-binding protein [Candidatus Bathyarchaeia archaeon]